MVFWGALVGQGPLGVALTPTIARYDTGVAMNSSYNIIT